MGHRRSAIASPGRAANRHLRWQGLARRRALLHGAHPSPISAAASVGILVSGAECPYLRPRRQRQARRVVLLARLRSASGRVDRAKLFSPALRARRNARPARRRKSPLSLPPQKSALIRCRRLRLHIHICSSHSRARHLGILPRRALFALLQHPSGLRTGGVHHQPYEIATPRLDTWSARPLRWNGWAAPTRPPDHVLGSSGVDVEVFSLER